MSKLNSGLYSSDDHTWETPPELVQALLEFEGRENFDLDPCCSSKNIPAKRHFIDFEENGLIEPWGLDRLVFVNPPYGDCLKLFLKKINQETRYSNKMRFLCPVVYNPPHALPPELGFRSNSTTRFGLNANDKINTFIFLREFFTSSIRFFGVFTHLFSV